MIAIIDIGNSAAKICEVRDGGLPGDIVTAPLANIDALLNLEPMRKAAQVILACSGDVSLADKLTAHLRQTSVNVFHVDASGALPFHSEYAPGQAGIDRLANVAAALTDVGSPAIVIDAGSAITLEAINSDEVFCGGAIFPGFSLQASALHDGTARLPGVTIEAATPIIGADTTGAIRSGILYGCLGAVDRLIRLTMDEPGMVNAAIVFTGGDAPLIADSLNLTGAVNAPELTLRGLYLLARHQHPELAL